MLKSFKLSLLLILAISLLLQPQKAAATSDVTITIVENPLALTEVVAPTFGRYINSAEEQLITATGDLLIQVKDTRTNRESPWSLHYQLTAFSDQTAYSLEIELGAGELTSDLADSLSYQSHRVNLLENQTGELLEAYSTAAENYQYRIPKEAIQLRLPKDIQIGNYHAIQTVNLLNISEPQ